MKKIILLLAFCLSAEAGISRTTKGKEFWVGFMENLALAFNGPPAFKLHISADITTNCTVTIPFTGYNSTFVINTNQVYVFTLPAGNFFPQGDEAIANNGIKIVASDSIEVKAFHHRAYFTESTIVLPVGELGSDYLITACTEGNGNNPSEFIIVATQNNTSVQIIPSVVTIGTRPAGVAFTVTLQQGQMYQLQSFSDFTGTSVKSVDPTRKIAVFGGARQAKLGCGSAADDHVYDQVYPVSSAGTNYHVVPFSGHLSDIVKILATQNNSSITVSGGGSYTLNKGQYATFTVNTSCVINSNLPVFVSQLATSQLCNGSMTTALGDPGMINLVPSDLTRKKTVFYTVPSLKLGSVSDFFPVHRLNIVVKTTAIGNLRLDNVAIPSNSFTPVNGTSVYSYARLVLDTLSSLQHTLACDSGFNASIYAFPQFNFYGHHLGYDKPLVILNPTGLLDNEGADALTVFPIPAQQILNIHSASIIRSIKIIDQYGNTAVADHDFSANDVTLNIEDLPQGVYYCIVRCKDQETAKVVKFIR